MGGDGAPPGASASNPFARVRLVVFDLDGTLIDSGRDLAKAVNTMLARLAPQSATLSLEEVRACVGNGARRLVARTLERARLATPLDQALAIFLEAYRACLLETTCLYPGVARALERLQPKLAVLTNKPGDMSRTILAGLGVADRFFRIRGGDEAPRKPDPAGLLALAAEAGCQRAETLIVGDSAIDVRTGRAAGVPTIGVTYGFDPEGLRRSEPDALLADLGELPELLAAGGAGGRRASGR
jgi:phosphoglycolate phosphatase